MSDKLTEDNKCILQKNDNPAGGMQMHWMILDLKGNVMMANLRTFMDAVIVAERAGLEVVMTKNGTHVHM